MEIITKNNIQEQALQAILPHNRSGCAVTMGGGKTLIGLRHMDKHYTDYCKFLVVAPKKSIFQSWKDDIEKFNLQHLLPHITFTTYMSLDKQDNDWDVIYLDEMHSLLLSHDYFLSMYGGKIVGLTGTKPRFKTSEKGKMVEKYCPVVYEYSTDEAVEDDILNDYEIRVHMLSLDTNKTILVTRPDKQWYTSEQDIYNYWTRRIDEATTAKSLQICRIQRMKAMMEFPSKERLATKLMSNITNKCLIFANTILQAERLCNYNYTSTNPKSEENLKLFKDGTIKQLSAVQQLSEGVNIPDLKESIILHCYGSGTKFHQRFGRNLRLNPNDKAIINLLGYEDTIDMKWISDSLSLLDQIKIIYI